MKPTLRFITVLGLAPLSALASDSMPALANVTPSTRDTRTAPASEDWTGKNFDDSAWRKTDDGASLLAAFFINPVNWEGIQSTLIEAKGKGVPVMTVDAPVGDPVLVRCQVVLATDCGAEKLLLLC